ncbi:MAG: hypothetical protein PVJ57_17400 [Phycisphaerae bacterium]
MDKGRSARRWLRHLLVPGLCVLVVTLLGAEVAWAGDGAGQAVSSAQPPASQPAGGDNPTAEELTRQIEELVRQAQQEGTTAPPKTAPPVVRPVRPAPANPQTPTQKAPQAAKPASGCGGATGKLDLTPPAADQPQPKYVCEQPLVEAAPTWGGAMAEFVFKIKNEGEGVLNIRAKGG